ncbi:hypothetical protein ASPCADRAFT_205504 [Aspergillus carbonarius ITEM 5010]|uniref:Uncharacterized protein n=1 Tax=Aspergillus carbonarius (strain ITEM 5010) TaxID=602072 RepID=A0A1R3RUV1_ASPC5|nr:hypothetical protein ASPCADRAFT_205504 [Aspergillus carbonarius ITEM 5010]
MTPVLGSEPDAKVYLCTCTCDRPIASPSRRIPHRDRENLETSQLHPTVVRQISLPGVRKGSTGEVNN